MMLQTIFAIMMAKCPNQRGSVELLEQPFGAASELVSVHMGVRNKV
jgi:hypothetical protein